MLHLAVTRETVYGLCGVGDVVLTAMGALSRNRALGQRLGKGETIAGVMKDTEVMPEGINTGASSVSTHGKTKYFAAIVSGYV